MYKISYTIGKVNPQMILRLSFIITEDSDPKPNYNQKFTPLVEKFDFQGTKIMRFNPKPYVSIELNPNDNEKNPNAKVNMNRYGIFCLIQALEKMKRQFIGIKDLYYYYDGRLTIDKNKAENIVNVIDINNKKIMLQPVVVEDQYSGAHEGIAFVINSYENFCYLTYGEMEYLRYTLSELDIDDIVLHLMSLIRQSGKAPTPEMIKESIPK